MKTTRILSGLLVVVFFVSCAPNNRADCFMEASKAPTSRGVEAAMYACNEKFPK